MAKKLDLNTIAPPLQLLDAEGIPVSLTDFAGKPVALLFMRYAGCPVCQMETAAFRQAFADYQRAGLELVMIFQSTPENLRQFAVDEALPFRVLSDPKRETYKAWGVDWGISGFLSPRNLAPIANALKAGHRHGKFEGNEFQYPAAFIVDAEQKVRFCHYGTNVSDNISPQDLLDVYRHLES